MSRRPRDYYPTPPWCLRRLAEVVDLGRLGAPPHPARGNAPKPLIATAWEPAAGRGHLADVVGEYLHPGCEFERSDIEPAPTVKRADFFEGEPDTAPALIITNPPYSAADRFVRRALELVHERGAVVMLLRITWLGGALEAHRDHWIRYHAPSVYVLPERPGFMGGGGGDSAPSAWCVWRDIDAPTPAGEFRVLATTPVEERRADEAAVAHEGLPSRQTSLFEEAV